jgi:pyruvate,water dikinase
MVRSDLAASGVMFSIDPETGFRNAASICAAYGLGENVVQGAVNPDEFLVFKPTLTDGFRPILQKRLGSKSIRMVYDLGGSKLTKNVPVIAADCGKFAIDDDEILTLARSSSHPVNPNPKGSKLSNTMNAELHILVVSFHYRYFIFNYA